MKESRTVPRPAAVESPRHLPLVDLLVDARSELFELAVRSTTLSQVSGVLSAMNWAAHPARRPSPPSESRAQEELRK